MANLYVYLLPAILHAVYACVPLTPPRPRPTPKPPGATGEVPATTTTTETTTTTVEACSGTPDNSTVTEDGNRCVFPFKDGDILHTGCVDYKGKYDWCATSLKSDCSFDTWSKCLETTSKPEEKCLTEEVNSGKECLFPFMFEGKEHLECLPYKGKFWCGLTYEYDKQRWGYCTQALCPPTKVEATEVPVTTQGPTEVPATSQEPETTTTTTTSTTTTTTTSTTTEVTTLLDWEDAQTTVDIAVDGSFYSCNIDFKMTTDQGVKYKDVTSSCSGSSKTDDMIDKLGVHRFTLTMQSGIGLSCQVGAALMPQSLTLSVEVMESTLKCEPLDSQCITIGGNNFPDNCVFPYNYQGRHYKACTDSSKDPSKLWCPTVVTASGEAEKDSWGFCSPSCGYCAGSPIARGASDSQPCGFDCVLNPAKKKAGLEQATMSFNSPIQDKAKVVGGNYKFDFGSQTITISCPEKFHHPDLKGENTVIASCGPEQHRYTVKNKDGVILGTEIEKDFFGCDPCPQSMTYVKGSLESSDFKTNGLFNNIASVGLCHSECLERSLCNSFKFSKTDQKCELIQDVVDTVSSPTPSPPDYIICTKSGPIGGACSIANRKQRGCGLTGESCISNTDCQDYSGFPPECKETVAGGAKTCQTKICSKICKSAQFCDHSNVCKDVICAVTSDCSTVTDHLSCKQDINFGAPTCQSTSPCSATTSCSDGEYCTYAGICLAAVYCTSNSDCKSIVLSTLCKERVAGGAKTCQATTTCGSPCSSPAQFCDAANICQNVADPTLVILDNQKTDGPFRARSPNGKVVQWVPQGAPPGTRGEGPMIRPRPFSDIRRTFYKSAYSVMRNIPITAVLTVEGDAVGTIDSTQPGVDGTLGKLVFRLAKLDKKDDFVSDMRIQVRPIAWYQKDPTRLARYSDKTKGVPTGDKNDYTNDGKYVKNMVTLGHAQGKVYTRGHLIRSGLFRAYFMKERYKQANPTNDDIDIPYDYSQYLTNIFPQVGPSNNQNHMTLDTQTFDWTGNSDNWHSNEIHEEQAMRTCFEKDITNKFHIAHGTIPSGNNGYILQNTHWETTRPLKTKPMNGPTNVNIPRYLYMAFCCSRGPYTFQKRFGEGLGDVTTTQYALFEQYIHEASVIANQMAADKGDRIERFATASDLQNRINQLWKNEHPNEKPFLFTDKTELIGEACRGFDVNI